MVELADQFLQKSFLLLPVPVGLLDRAASASDRAEGPAGLIGAEIGRLRIGMLLDLPGLEVEKFFVPGILQDQRLFPVADDHPIALPDFQLLHSVPLRSSAIKPRHSRGVLVLDQFSSNGKRPARRFRSGQFVALNSRRAITCAWISAAPSKMLRMRASQRMREIGNSSVNPLPPWICTALSAAAHATRAASSLAMPASRSHRRPESFCRAAKYVSWRAIRISAAIMTILSATRGNPTIGSPNCAR